MAVLEIKKFNEPVLRKKAEKVDKITSEIKRIISDMVETLKDSGGVGLAATQVGISKRIIIVELDSKYLPVINPEIVKRGKEKGIEEEGCLSVPDIFDEVKRIKDIEVKGLDKNGKDIHIVLSGFPARIFQHEIDHINGILFIDRLSILKKIKFKLRNPSVKVKLWV